MSSPVDLDFVWMAVYFFKRIKTFPRLLISSSMALAFTFLFYQFLPSIPFSLYITIGEFLRDGTNYRLNIFYWDYSGFLLILTLIITLALFAGINFLTTKPAKKKS